MTDLLYVGQKHPRWIIGLLFWTRLVIYDTRLSIRAIKDVGANTIWEPTLLLDYNLHCVADHLNI